MYIYVHVHVYVYIGICMCACICIPICVCVHIHKWQNEMSVHVCRNNTLIWGKDLKHIKMDGYWPSGGQQLNEGEGPFS